MLSFIIAIFIILSFNAPADSNTISDTVMTANLDGSTLVLGNIGMGVTSPTQKMDIAGNIKATAFIGDGSQLINLPSPSMTITNGVSRSMVTSTSATGFQISSTKKTMVVYSVKISTSSTIGGSAEGEVYLETAATNSITPSDWTTISKISSGQTITLAIALQSVQPITGQLIGMIAVGNYVRLRSNNVSGTPTYTYITGQETII